MLPKHPSWWLGYWLAVALVAIAMTGVTVVVLDMEDDRLRELSAAKQQELKRLALWRMDAWMSPRLGREAARPFDHYLPFFANRDAYTSLFGRIPFGDVLTPSPLLTTRSSIFPLHFQIDEHGAIQSPQVPTGNALDVSEYSLGLAPGAFDDKRVLLENVKRLLSEEEVREAWTSAESLLERDTTVALCDTLTREINAAELTLDRPAIQASRNKLENERRKQNAAQIQQSVQSEDAAHLKWSHPDDSIEPGDETNSIRVGPLVPVWINGSIDSDSVDDTLIYVRCIWDGHREYFQGVLVDWALLRQALLEQAADLSFSAALVPVVSRDLTDEDNVWMLATVPATLESTSEATGATAPWTPVRVALGLTWLALVIACGATGWALRSSIDFGQRRNRFASAVTHELRTPLTTFQLYTEMLDEGMVKDEQKRQTYFKALRSESTRLSALVENVLAYARIEDGAASLACAPLSLQDILTRDLPSLERRVASCDAKLDLQVHDSSHVKYLIDQDSISQVVFNLVDNACKYGCTGPSKRIQISIDVVDGHLLINVRDDGPGIPSEMTRQVFEPFDRGDIDAGSRISGVGIGLSLSRELSAAMGGTLKSLSPDTGGYGGAVFQLRIPIVAAPLQQGP